MLSGTTSSRAIAILFTTTFVFFFAIVMIHQLTCAGCGQLPKAAVVLGAFSVALFAVGCLAATIGLLRSLTNVVTVVFFFRFSTERVAEAPRKIFHGIIWFAIGIILCLPFTYLSSIGDLSTN